MTLIPSIHFTLIDQSHRAMMQVTQVIYLLTRQAVWTLASQRLLLVVEATIYLNYYQVCNANTKQEQTNTQTLLLLLYQDDHEHTEEDKMYSLNEWNVFLCPVSRMLSYCLDGIDFSTCDSSDQ